MGLTYVDATVRGPKGARKIRFLVDSGATYSLLPEKIWHGIGLKPKRRMAFSLADGTAIERDISECQVSLPAGTGYSPVILGGAKDTALLGAVTLETLGLVLNPFERTLQPMRAMLASQPARRSPGARQA